MGKASGRPSPSAVASRATGCVRMNSAVSSSIAGVIVPPRQPTGYALHRMRLQLALQLKVLRVILHVAQDAHPLAPGQLREDGGDLTIRANRGGALLPPRLSHAAA